jgi:hypothetical protein
VFLIYKPKKLIVTKEIDKDIRKEFSSFELLNTYKTKKGLKSKVDNLALRYKIEDVDYRVPVNKPVPQKRFHEYTPEQQKEISRKISESKKGKPRDLETRIKISKSLRVSQIKRNRTQAEKLMYTAFRTKLGYKYRWIVNKYTGDLKQIRLNQDPPEGWMFRKHGGMG